MIFKSKLRLKYLLELQLCVVVARRLVIEYDHSNVKCLSGRAMNPQVACEANMGMENPSHWVDTSMLVDWSTRALRVRRFSLSALERLFSEWMASLWIRFRQAGLSDAVISHVATSMLKSFRYALRECFVALALASCFPATTTEITLQQLLRYLESDIQLTCPAHRV